MLGETCNFQSNFIPRGKKIWHQSLDSLIKVAWFVVHLCPSCNCGVSRADKTVFVSTHLDHQFSEYKRPSNARLGYSLAHSTCVHSVAFGVECAFLHAGKKLHDFHPSVVVGKINIMIGLFVGVRVFLLNCLVGRETHCLLCRLYTILMMHLFYLHLNFATTPTSRHISESSFAQI